MSKQRHANSRTVLNSLTAGVKHVLQLFHGLSCVLCQSPEHIGVAIVPKHKHVSSANGPQHPDQILGSRRLCPRSELVQYCNKLCYFCLHQTPLNQQQSQDVSEDQAGAHCWFGRLRRSSRPQRFAEVVLSPWGKRVAKQAHTSACTVGKHTRLGLSCSCNLCHSVATLTGA